MEILETKGRKMNKIKREERENLHTFSDTTLYSFYLFGCYTNQYTNLFMVTLIVNNKSPV